MLLICQQYPELKIYNPANGSFTDFHGGKLQIEEDDPNYAAVMAEADRNPAIAVYSKAVICERCGEPFSGKTAKANLGQHVKAVHPEDYFAAKEAENAAEVQKEIKARAPLACDVAGHENQTFPDAASLALHMQAWHAAAPELDDEGNTVGSE